MALTALSACRNNSGNTTDAPAPQPPIARADNATVAEESQGNRIDVLANDSAADTPIRLDSVEASSENGGSARLDGQRVVYDAPSGYSGSDSFSYTIIDEDGDTATALVTVSVQGPLVANDDTARTKQSTSVRIDVLANDSSGSGQRLLDSFDASTANGTVQRDDRGTASDTSDDQLVYTPAGGFTGTEQFGYTVADGSGNTASAQVTVEVTAPAQANDDILTVDRDSTDNRLAVLSNDSADMRVTALDSSASVDGADIRIADDGSAVIYSPPAGYTGNDQFSYTAERSVDGETESDTALVSITVREPPVGTNACRTNVEQRLDAGQGYCYDATLTTSNGVLIDFTVFVPHPDQLRANAETTTGTPLAADEPGFAPLLIHGHGFGGAKYGDFSNPSTFLDAHIAKLAWEAGYFVITFSERGFGDSGGQIGLMSPRKEGYDFVELVNWANAHLRENFGFDVRADEHVAFDDSLASHTDPNVTPEPAWGRSLLMSDNFSRISSADASNPAGDIALATIGYSYGGGFQFNAQSVDTRVDAMIPMGTWFDLRFSLHPNDTPKTTWITIMTTFAGQGGNGEPLPPIISDANSEANGANADPNDQPHNKQRQVSVRNARKLGPNGTIGYCDGGEDVSPDPGFEPINDQTESEGDAPTPPPNAITNRAMRAHLFMVQGYNDTLFNYNEGYDNARCFEDQGDDGLDVRFLAQTSGHPLPSPLGPAHYAGSDTGMYLDEIVHCGLEGGVPKRYVMRDVGLAWFDFHLRGLLPNDVNGDTIQDADDIFPRACITQVNTDPNLRMKTGDDNPGFSGSNSSSTAFQYSREGAVFERIADMPRGCTGAGSNCQPITIDGGFTVTTGPDPSQQNPGQFLSLYTASNAQVMAGLPLVDLQLERANPTQDEVMMVGVAVQRCHADPRTSGDCEDNAPVLLHHQVLPIRVFPTAAAAPGQAGSSYPLDDPRNTLAQPAHYPLRFGDNPGFAGSNDTEAGRLLGVSARLHPGDQVGLIFYGEHPVFKSIASAAAGQVTVNGTVELPLMDPTPAPVDVPSYVIDDSVSGR